MDPRILIVDDHEIVRQGVRSLLAAARPAWEICGEAGSGREAIDAIRRLKPDVVVLDITMPEMSGLQVAARLRELGLSTRILFFTMHDSDSLPSEVRAAGGFGFVLKSQAARNLIQAIETIHGGGTFFGTSEADKKGGGTFGLGIFFRKGFSPA